MSKRKLLIILILSLLLSVSVPAFAFAAGNGDVMSGETEQSEYITILREDVSLDIPENSNENKTVNSAGNTASAGAGVIVYNDSVPDTGSYTVPSVFALSALSSAAASLIVSGKKKADERNKLRTSA